MKKIIIIIFFTGAFKLNAQQIPDSLKGYVTLIKASVLKDYKGMLKERQGSLKFPFITPGSRQYSNQLWDWDSWLSGIAVTSRLNKKLLPIKILTLPCRSNRT
jgi:putative isomerase